MDNQTQNSKPDFGFIFNQPTEPAKKPRNTKLLVVGCLAGVLIVFMFALSLFAKVQGNVKKVNATTVTIQSLLDGIQQNNPQQIIDLTAKDNQTDTKTVTNNLITPLTSLYDINACKIGTTTQKTVNSVAVSSTTITCPYKAPHQGYRANIIAETSLSQNKAYLTKITIAKVEKTNG